MGREVHVRPKRVVFLHNIHIFYCKLKFGALQKVALGSSSMSFNSSNGSTYWEVYTPNVVAVRRAGTPGKASSSQPIVLYQWTRLIPVISCQHRALSSLVLSTQIKLMKCNPLKCPGCISVTGLRTREGRQGGSQCHGRQGKPPSFSQP